MMLQHFFSSASLSFSLDESHVTNLHEKCARIVHFKLLKLVLLKLFFDFIVLKMEERCICIHIEITWSFKLKVTELRVFLVECSDRKIFANRQSSTILHWSGIFAVLWEAIEMHMIVRVRERNRVCEINIWANFHTK